MPLTTSPPCLVFVLASAPPYPHMEIDLLSDSDLLLALCIAEEGLANPTGFAARMRTLMKDMDQVTAANAETLDKEWAALREEADHAQAWLENHRVERNEQEDVFWDPI